MKKKDESPTFYNALLNPSAIRLSKNSYDLGYGIELGYHLVYSPSAGGIILGIRYGQTTALSDKRFKVNGDKSFRSEDRMTESYFSVTLKFYRKTD